MSNAALDVAVAIARGKLRRAAAAVVDLFIKETGLDPTPERREQMIDFVIDGGKLAVGASVIRGLFGPPARDPRPDLLDQPNVLWDFKGLMQCVWLAIDLMFDGAHIVGLDLDEQQELTRYVERRMAGRDAANRPGPQFWRYTIKYCLPQWSKGRVDQPNNARIQRKVPRNAQNKPHRSPLGRNW